MDLNFSKTESPWPVWRKQTAAEIVFQVCVTDDGKVWCIEGEGETVSEAISCTWDECLDGELNALIRSTMGQDILDELLSWLRAQRVKAPSVATLVGWPR